MFKGKFKYETSDGKIAVHVMDIFAETHADATDAVRDICMRKGFWVGGQFVPPGMIKTGTFESKKIPK